MTAHTTALPATTLPARRRQILFARRPEALPTPDCFDLVEGAIPDLAEGQVLVRNDLLSVDPYIRLRMEAQDSYAPVMAIGDVMVGRTAGQVIASRSADVPVGTWVVGRLGWQDHAVARAAELQIIDIQAAPLHLWLGALGSTGITAWIGLHEIAHLRRGDIVLVSAAAGAVGSVAGQLARQQGCRVIGIAGGDFKCTLVRERLGFDACVDHKRPNFAQQLAQALPDGVDVYFDNVGGPVLDAILPLARLGARIAVCGMVSQYNRTEPYGVRNLREVFNRRITLRGFVISDHAARFAQAQSELLALHRSHQLVSLDTIAQGLAQAPQAFIGMLQGANTGKQLVEIEHPGPP